MFCCGCPGVAGSRGSGRVLPCSPADGAGGRRAAAAPAPRHPAGQWAADRPGHSASPPGSGACPLPQSRSWKVGFRAQTLSSPRGGGRTPLPAGAVQPGVSPGPLPGARGGAWRCDPAALSAAPPPQASLWQMGQTRFYVAERRAAVPRVSLFVGGLPPGLSHPEYGSLLDEAVATKGVTTWAGPGLLAPGRGGQGGGPQSGLWGLPGRAGSSCPLPHCCRVCRAGSPPGGSPQLRGPDWDSPLGAAAQPRRPCWALLG